MLPWIAHPLLASTGHYVTNVKYVKCLCNINLWTRSKYGRICNLLYIWQHVNRGSLVWSTCMSMAGRMAHCYELQDWHIPDVWSGDLLEFMAYSHRTWAGQGLGPIFTARKRSLVQDNVFTGVCLSMGRGVCLWVQGMVSCSCFFLLHTTASETFYVNCIQENCTCTFSCKL